MPNVNIALQSDPLVKLVSKDKGKETFVGWVYSIDYDTALVMTNDLWKANVRGIPHNCFLVAATFNPQQYADAQEADREVLLLRVVGSAKLPQDDDLIRTKIDNRQEQEDIYSGVRDFDELTLNQMQFGGLKCRVLGTFYIRDGHLYLGSDLESFAVAANLRVYRPRGDALETIVNHVDPTRQRSVQEEAQQLGLKKLVEPFPIGTVRYTSTDRLHRHAEEPKVPVRIQPSDFLARRTAVLGMTRTGKSNMIKQLVAVVKQVADEGGITVGQIIYDINGEYANANQQDKGAIADIYPNDTVRYRMLSTPGFEDLRNNFYEQIQEGFAIIKRELSDAGRITSDYIRKFVNLSFEEPPNRDQEERRLHSRWERYIAAYKVLLFKARFAPPKNHRVKFAANEHVRKRVKRKDGTDFPNPSTGLSLQDAAEWFEMAHATNEKEALPSSTKGETWVDDTLQLLMDMIARSQKGSYITGYGILADAVKYHSATRGPDEVAEQVYNSLQKGKIVILDLSVGDATMREKISKQIVSHIFNASMKTFTEGELPPNIVVYIEEAHNLIGKGMDITETWPRLAKEGAKYRIALVYATQEVSSVHPNILANTENWFVTHLNNEREIRELARFYDFEDFSRSLMRAQDVGFARVKTLSGPFVIPVQIDLFDPEAEKQRISAYQNMNDEVSQGQLL